GNERTGVSFLVARTLLGTANSSHHHTRGTYIPVLEAGARTITDGQRGGAGIGQAGHPACTLQASRVHGIAQIPCGSHGSPNAAHTVRADASRADKPSSSTYVASFSAGQGAKAGGIGYREEQAPTLKSGASGRRQEDDYNLVAPTVFQQNQRDEVRTM